MKDFSFQYSLSKLGYILDSSLSHRIETLRGLLACLAHSYEVWIALTIYLSIHLIRYLRFWTNWFSGIVSSAGRMTIAEKKVGYILKRGAVTLERRRGAFTCSFRRNNLSLTEHKRGIWCPTNLFETFWTKKKTLQRHYEWKLEKKLLEFRNSKCQKNNAFLFSWKNLVGWAFFRHLPVLLYLTRSPPGSWFNGCQLASSIDWLDF